MITKLIKVQQHRRSSRSPVPDGSCLQEGKFSSTFIMQGSGGGEVEVDSFPWSVLSALPVEAQR